MFPDLARHSFIIGCKKFMRLIRQFFRIIHINVVLVRHGLEEVIFAIHLFRPIRFLLFLLPWHWFRKKEISAGGANSTSARRLRPNFC